MNPAPHSLVWLNGALLPRGQARLPIDDRAFRYGDGLFETLRLRDGRPEFWRAHKDRLQAGMRALGFPALPYDLDGAARTLIAANSCHSGVLRIALSRGSGGRGYLPPADGVPTLLLETFPLTAPQPEPLTLWLAAIRRPGPEHGPMQHKLSSALGSVLARMEAETQGCGEALLLDAAGHVSEASGANLIWQAQDGRLYTPGLQSGAVAGVARGALMRALGIEECLAPLGQLETATALIACNSLRHAMPARALNPQGWVWDSGTLAARCNTALAEAAEASLAEFS